MNNNIENFMEFDIKKNNNINESDSDEDFIFNYERYRISEVRKDIITKLNNEKSGIDSEEESIEKDYNYYKDLGYFK